MPPYRNALVWLWREIRIAIPIGVLSTVLFGAFAQESFASNLKYSLSITLCIQTLIEAGRYGLAALVQRRRAAAASATKAGAAQRAWPGWALMAPWLVFSVALGYFAGHALGDWLTGVHRDPFAFFRDRSVLLPTFGPSLALTLGCTWFFYARGRLATMQARTETALRAAAETQLRLLVSQLEPHMLFNTLANLRVLIGSDPPRAQAMLDHLNGFLRATLDASRADAHALTAEFARVRDYLELMQVRMGPRLRATLDLPATLGALPVPPLLLQPLVENALKHGLEPNVAGGEIVVSAHREGATLILSVRDTGAGLQAPPADGTRFGLRQVRERLAALYGDAAQLTLTEPEDGRGGALAIVRLPIGNPAPALA
ncbi:signal transduction histidine kinase [Paraburkholderia bannensis]|uniref:Signal transduction histidine kinase n=1 Tax=Paraburkholderia bannensis TaxID=765414 RepID=A0A7W9U2S7_9BURK|nr:MULTISPECIES: histidine kinase [Paraburkholderia]MBB3259890.1 signal transduction histidine kinase [Paraburkholderia sp. WP4_3_2]MBB6104800.1 signal transduction histidine kinase [Paraburkholderia bannensis]